MKLELGGTLSSWATLLITTPTFIFGVKSLLKKSSPYVKVFVSEGTDIRDDDRVDYETKINFSTIYISIGNLGDRPYILNYLEIEYKDKRGENIVQHIIGEPFIVEQNIINEIERVATSLDGDIDENYPLSHDVFLSAKKGQAIFRYKISTNNHKLMSKLFYRKNKLKTKAIEINNI